MLDKAGNLPLLAFHQSMGSVPSPSRFKRKYLALHREFYSKKTCMKVQKIIAEKNFQIRVEKEYTYSSNSSSSNVALAFTAKILLKTGEGAGLLRD
jgi:hypothetical protein